MHCGTFPQGTDCKNGHDARRFLQTGFPSGEEGMKWETGKKRQEK